MIAHVIVPCVGNDDIQFGIKLSDERVAFATFHRVLVTISNVYFSLMEQMIDEESPLYIEDLDEIELMETIVDRLPVEVVPIDGMTSKDFCTTITTPPIG